MKVCSVCQRCYEDPAEFCAEDNQPLAGAQRGDPQMIAGYCLDRLLETSGNFEVFRARQATSGQTCLIKIIAADQTENSRHFLSEAKTAIALAHPNIAEVYEAGVLESGELFVVAEDPDGQTLRELLEAGGVPLVTAIQVARQTAEALHAVHLQGLTHRAVNPANITLTFDAAGRPAVKIQNFDFGGIGGQFITSSRFVSASGLNSLKYFAPEQCAGAAATGAPTDIYSLGIVFYEMLSGAPPFDAPTAALIIEKQKNQPPPEIKINNFDLRMLLTHTLMEALRKPARLRHKSAAAFARQLRHIEQLATHSPTPPPAMIITPPAATKPVINAEPVQAFDIQPAAAAEIAAEIFTENKEPVAAGSENEPAAVFTAENEPLANLEIPEMDLPARQEPADPLPPEPGIENYFVAEAVLPLPRAMVETEAPAGEILPPEPAESKTIHAGSAEISPAAVQGDTTLVEWEQPEDDIPSETETAEIRVWEPPIEPAAGEVAAQSGAPDFSPEKDLSPPAEEDGSLPAFMRKADQRKSADRRGSIFAADGAASGHGFAADHRSLYVGGLIGLLVLFLAGYAFLIRAGFFGEPVTAKTTPAQKSLPSKLEPAEPVSPARQNSETAPLPPEDEANFDQLRPLPPDAPPPLNAAKPPVSAAAKPSVRKPPGKLPDVARTAVEKPPVSTSAEKPVLSSTIVIFPENGKIKSRVEIESKPAKKSPPKVINQTDDFTRQRIVKNPKNERK